MVPLNDAADPGEFGGKGYQLGRALAAGLPVPPGFAVSVSQLSAVERGEAYALNRVREIVRTLGPPLAARSSGIGEDAADASFAGQHLTVLNLLTADAVIAGLKQVYESAHTPAALAYRQRQGVSGPVRVAAVVQKLVDSDCAGVLFTRNPMTGADEIVIEAAWGLGETVVAGLVTPDHYRVSRDGRIIETRIGEKDVAVRRCTDGGTKEMKVPPDEIHARCLDNSWLGRLRELALRAEAAFGRGLDLEWACVGNALYLLQSRPITTR